MHVISVFIIFKNWNEVKKNHVHAGLSGAVTISEQYQWLMLRFMGKIKY